MYKFLRKLFSNKGAMGLPDDQISVYLKNMYKAERESDKEVPTLYNKLFKVVPNASGGGDKFTQLLKAGPLTRHTSIGQNIQYNSPIEGWTTSVGYKTYSDGLAFAPEAIEDTVKLGNMLKDLAGTWGEEVRVAKEEWAARVFNSEGSALSGDTVLNGTHPGNTDSSGDLMYDSKPMFNLTGNKRTTKGGSTYYNAVTGLSLNIDNFATLYNLATASNNRDEQDRVKANPVDTLLTGVGADADMARRIIKSESLPGGELNDINPQHNKVSNLYAWDYLSDSAFYVGKAKAKEIEFHERLAPTMRFFRNENNAGYNASIRVRFGIHMKPGSWKRWTKGGGTYA